jgi:mannose-1-phosphate guanylyltransferase
VIELGVVPTQIQPVILCGGSGTRLSLQETGARCRGLAATVAPLVICNEAHRFMVGDQLRRIGIRSDAILLEPEGRGSAPALTLAAVHCVTADDPVLLVMPADHRIARTDAFERAVERAAALARQGYLVVFGVRPGNAGIGYGCIRAGARVNGAHAVEASFVERFVEEPDRDERCFWNAGIVAVRASVWIDAIGSLRRDILASCERAYRQGGRDGEFLRIDARTFAGCPADSIDYAVLQRLAAGHGVPEAVMVRLESNSGNSGSGS